MGARIAPRGVTAAGNRELQVAAAVAREAVVQLHVEHALALIRSAAGQVPELRMLEIYTRLLELAGPAEEVVANRVLAALGHARAGAEPGDAFADPEAVRYDDVSVLHTLRRRLRGRVHSALRRTVELRTGVAKAALLDTHITHARGFVALLGGTHDIHEACRVYTTLVSTPAPLAAVLYIMVLNRIAQDEPAAMWSPAADEPAAVSAGDAGSGAREPRPPARPPIRQQQLARTPA